MDYTKSCHVRGERMSVHQRARAPLRERPEVRKPFERIEVDIKGPLPRTVKKPQYILVIQDAFSKYVELSPLQRQTTDEVCGRLQEWISRYGLPESIHSDNGSRLQAGPLRNSAAGMAYLILQCIIHKQTVLWSDSIGHWERCWQRL